MKKGLLIFISAIIILTVFAGCSDPLKDNYKKATASTEATEKVQEKKEYENNFNGLKSYMIDNGYIKESDKGTEMNAELIGAEKGYIYTNGKIKIELYEYNTKKLSKKAKKYIDSVNKDGCFEIYDQKINAYLTEDNKFMMIYNDDEKKAETEKQTVEDFENFNK